VAAPGRDAGAAIGNARPACRPNFAIARDASHHREYFAAFSSGWRSRFLQSRSGQAAALAGPARQYHVDGADRHGCGAGGKGPSCMISGNSTSSSSGAMARREFASYDRMLADEALQLPALGGSSKNQVGFSAAPARRPAPAARWPSVITAEGSAGWARPRLIQRLMQAASALPAGASRNGAGEWVSSRSRTAAWSSTALSQAAVSRGSPPSGGIAITPIRAAQVRKNCAGASLRSAGGGGGGRASSRRGNRLWRVEHARAGHAYAISAGPARRNWPARAAAMWGQHRDACRDAPTPITAR